MHVDPEDLNERDMLPLLDMSSPHNEFNMLLMRHGTDFFREDNTVAHDKPRVDASSTEPSDDDLKRKAMDLIYAELSKRNTLTLGEIQVAGGIDRLSECQEVLATLEKVHHLSPERFTALARNTITEIAYELATWFSVDLLEKRLHVGTELVERHRKHVTIDGVEYPCEGVRTIEDETAKELMQLLYPNLSRGAA